MSNDEDSVVDRSLLNPLELLILVSLGEAWDRFSKLPELHPQDKGEFLQAIHQAQLLVMSRPVAENMNKLKEELNDNT